MAQSEAEPEHHDRAVPIETKNLQSDDVRKAGILKHFNLEGKSIEITPTGEGIDRKNFRANVTDVQLSTLLRFAAAGGRQIMIELPRRVDDIYFWAVRGKGEMWAEKTFPSQGSIGVAERLGPVLAGTHIEIVL